MITVIIHILNEDPIVGELEEMPGSDLANLIVHQPRLRDGKPLPYVERDVNRVIWPMHRINFIEVFSTESEEEIISHVRE